MKAHAYLFEAHSIQQYILDSGRLAEMVGASELVESLVAPNGLLERAQKALGLSESRGEIRYSRRAGGAVSAFFPDPEKAREFRDLWGLLVGQYAPGLAYSHVVVCAENEVKAAVEGEKALRRLKQAPMAVHPLAAPPVRRSPRTGLPATDLGTPWSDDERRREWTDRASHMKSAGRFRSAHALRDKFERPEGWHWPTLFDPDEDDCAEEKCFPFLKDNAYVGVVHADGNELGGHVETLRNALIQGKRDDDYAQLFLRFSDAIGDATARAAKAAAERIAEHESKSDLSDNNEVLPARPLVLGGDDLTIIVRAGCALEYTERFIEAFKYETGKAFRTLKAADSVFDALPSHLSACAGVAFIKKTQPFYLAYALAEDMCRYAKNASRRARGGDTSQPLCGSLVFSRVTTSFISERYRDLRDEELTMVRDEEHFRMTLGAYGVGDPEVDLPRLEHLGAFKAFLAEPRMSRGPGRKLLSLLQTQPDEAQRAYGRWKQNLKDAQEKTRVDTRWNDIVRHLNELGVDADRALPYVDVRTGVFATPLGDALAWLAVTGIMEDQNND